MNNKKFKKAFKGVPNKSFIPNNIYVNNISMSQAFELFDSVNNDLAKPLFESFVMTGLILLMMAQISISSEPESSQWVDQLPSYRALKSFINTKMGLTVAACFGLSIAFGYAMDDLGREDKQRFEKLILLVPEMVESQSANTKRLKPSKSNWLAFARGEMGAAKGQMLSCPNTNLAKLNIDRSSISSHGLKEALNSLGFDKELFMKYDFGPEQIRTKVRNYFLIDSTGKPINTITYHEPIFIKSKLQSELLGDSITRLGDILIKFETGVGPITEISKSNLKQLFSKSEYFAYNIAVRTGDISMIKRLSTLAIERSKSQNFTS